MAATKVTPAQVAAQIAADGGSVNQQMVGAALVSGIESSGDPTVLSGGVGPAAGLFQFEPATWISNGGGAYANVAQDATWQDQVAVFVNATKGDNFGAWGPDLGGAYGYSGLPLPGSPVANKIAELGNTLTVTGPNPTGTVGQILNDIPGYSAVAGGVDNTTQLISDVLHPSQIIAFWERLGMALLGATLFGVGLVVYFAGTDTGKKTASEAVQLAPLALA